MYDEGGVAYVYLIYGMHWMLNVVTGQKEQPQAVLIRGLKGINGPGRVTKYLEIDKSFNAENFYHSKRIWFEKPENALTRFKAGPRIGVDYAGEYWSAIPWRFWID
jgi:DNA-3-methyladenine glycosylase